VIVEARSAHARGAAAAVRLRERACCYLSALGREDAEVSILVVDDAYIRRLNRKWRGKDEPTDVLSFPQGAPGAGALLGDLVISLETARRVARRDGRRIGAELDRYLAHGLLHLLGHDHERPEDARKMSMAEDALVGEGMIAVSLGGSGAAPPTSKTAKPAARSRQRASAPKALPAGLRR
jgi:probable rRNA maturation factor